MWARIVNAVQARSFAEVGVFRGHFAEQVLKDCESIDQYYMIDPWRHLDDWNKPANRSDREFTEIKNEALSRTEFASDKRIILQGKTTEVSSEIPDDSLDFVYIDGDHTLRGIAIDLIRMWPKIKEGGVVAGDDFCSSIWQHDKKYEPTLIFPFAVYFAEAHGATICGLPFNQFAIVADTSSGGAFAFHDMTGKYHSTELREALSTPPSHSTFGRCLRKFKRAIAAIRSR